MVQVAFDTQEFVDTLEKEGLPRNQAKAITLVVRKSHEVADLATKEDIKDVKRDLEDVRKDLSAEIADVRKDMEHRFEKVELQILDVRKDLSAEIANVRKDLSADIVLVRKDMEALTNSLLIKITAMMAGIVSLAAAFLKFF